MRYILVPLVMILININSIAQTTTDWFPSNLNIQPFTAHFLEPKAGFQYLFDLEKVRIDIGTNANGEVTCSCTSTKQVMPQTVNLALSLNRADFTTNVLRFTYVPDLKLVSIPPVHV